MEMGRPRAAAPGPGQGIAGGEANASRFRVDVHLVLQAAVLLRVHHSFDPGMEPAEMGIEDGPSVLHTEIDRASIAATGCARAKHPSSQRRTHRDALVPSGGEVEPTVIVPPPVLAESGGEDRRLDHRIHGQRQLIRRSNGPGKGRRDEPNKKNSTGADAHGGGGYQRGRIRSNPCHMHG